MTRYRLVDRRNSQEYIVEAKDKRDLRVKAYGTVPDGIYEVLNRDGSHKYSIAVNRNSSKRAQNAKPRVSKDQYDQLFYYMGDSAFRQVIGGADPLMFTSPRRYDSIQEARKGALAKSKKEWVSIIEAPSGAFQHSLTQHIFKGRKYLGFVEYNNLKGKENGRFDFFDGYWTPVERPKDPLTILADGSIGARKLKRRL